MSRAPRTSGAAGRRTTAQTFTDAASALRHATVLYDAATQRLRKALQGRLVGWGKLDRTASVLIHPAKPAP